MIHPVEWVLGRVLGPKIPLGLWKVLPDALRASRRLKGKHMDPVTAIFNFLSTAEGQLICKEVRTEVGELIKLFHKTTSAVQAAQAAATPKAA
jgi:hypothetical protein